jgi:thymidylate kinase
MAIPPVVLVLDGHDGVGKTTLAARLAKELNGQHLRPYSGTLGELFLWCGEGNDPDFANALALKSIQRARETAHARCLIFDRHWMTALSVLPERLWRAWQPVPPTTLCWVDIDETLRRLESRGEPRGSLEQHRHYLERYEQLARKFGCNILRTQARSEDESFAELLAWAQPYVKGL